MLNQEDGGTAQGQAGRDVTVVLPLDEGWELFEALGETWRWHVGVPASGLNNVGDAVARARGWFPARVPGTVLDDLVRDGQAPDPRHGLNSRAGEWAASRFWVYRRLVDVPPLGPADLVTLELGGADPSAVVYWDGAEVGAVDGMFRAARLPVPPVPGRHQLTIVVPPALEMEPQVGRTEAVATLAPRMTAGWDFCPRLPHQGLWRPVRLRIGAAQLGRVSAGVRLEGDRGIVTVDLDLAAPDARTVRAVLTLRGVEVTAVEQRLAPGHHRIELPVSDPERWWPVGLGPATRYALEVEVVGAEERRALQVGFRDLRWHANPAAPARAHPYSLAVNGREVVLIGWNWVPVDARYGTIDQDRTRHLVQLAALSGARLLRVWGGGLLESEEFYEACDAAGLLVWQEFPQSSSGMQSAPSEDPAFVARAVAVAEEVLPRLAHHPSLVLLGGGNELEDGRGPLEDDRSPVLAALHAVVRRMAPDRGWLPTSPTGPVFHNRLDVIRAAPDDQHDVHGPWEHQGLVEQYTLANVGTSLAHTEFGVEGMTNRRALDAVIPDDQQWPVGRENPLYRHLGDWWNNEPLVQTAFGGRLTDVGRLLRASQFLQATGLQYAVEGDRRRRPRCSMVLPWQLGESFPNAWCTSSVDYHGEPKPSYHAVTRAFAAERITIRVDRMIAGGIPLRAEGWVWSEQGVPAGSTVDLRLRTADGAVLAAAAGIAEDAVGYPRHVIELTVDDVPEHAVVFWEAEWRDHDGRLRDRELALAATGHDLVPLLDLPPADLDVAVRLDDDSWEVAIHHLRGPAAVGLELHDARPVDAVGWPLLHTDPRPLMPGESRSIRVEWRQAAGPRALRLDGWNATERMVVP